ncbi:MAG: GNAT family N-acetyltransferase [Acidipila sp.]|nr:GNAT family N-acetyltransferase [Acidipila sp.]
MDADFSTLRITRAGAEQMDWIAPLFEAYREFYRRPPDPRGTRAFLAERLKREESVMFLALVQTGNSSTAVGFVHLYPTFSSLSLKPQWILSDLFVTPEARSRGVGAALMDRAKELAEGSGADGLMLETATDNLTAQKLYESLGYKRDIEFYRYFLAV